MTAGIIVRVVAEQLPIVGARRGDLAVFYAEEIRDGLPVAFAVHERTKYFQMVTWPRFFGEFAVVGFSVITQEFAVKHQDSPPHRDAREILSPIFAYPWPSLDKVALPDSRTPTLDKFKTLQTCHPLSG